MKQVALFMLDPKFILIKLINIELFKLLCLITNIIRN